MQTWALSEEIYRALHDWPKIAAFFLAGCLLGWLLSLVLPVPYRASMQVYVGLNPYRAYEDVKFLSSVDPRYSNPDDYKNWQMSQLNGVLLLEDLIREALEALREKDPAWESVSEEQLRAMLRTEWRTAGEWALVAENRRSAMATQAAAAWGQAGVNRVRAAVEAARELIRIDQQSGAVAEQIAAQQSRLAGLTAGKSQIGEWLEALAGEPQDQALPEPRRSQILGLVAGLATFEPDWMQLLHEQPGAAADVAEYHAWAARTASQIDQEITQLRQTIDQLEQEQSRLGEQYAAQSDLSLGLSPNLEIESMVLDPARRIRPSGLLALIGGVLGLGVWALIELMRISRRMNAHAG